MKINIIRYRNPKTVIYNCDFDSYRYTVVDSDEKGVTDNPKIIEDLLNVESSEIESEEEFDIYSFDDIYEIIDSWEVPQWIYWNMPEDLLEQLVRHSSIDALYMTADRALNWRCPEVAPSMRELCERLGIDYDSYDSYNELFWAIEDSIH